MGEQSEDKRWTLLELLNWTTTYFERAGIESARLNAELLLAEAAGLQRIMLYARFDQVMGPDRQQLFRDMVRRRAAREPLQHLLGRAEFYGRPFNVTPAVLIPRQETEFVVEKCLEKIPADGAGFRAADVGTGSGVIAVTLACERPQLLVAATDASAEALQVARKNAEKHGVADRVTFAQGHLCEPLQPGTGPPGLIASNPPYIPSGQIERLQPEVRDHDPRLALDGGPDGLRVIAQLVPAAARALAPGGWLVLELGEGQAGAVRDMIAAAEAFDPGSVETVSDSGPCERVLAVRTMGG